MIIIRNYCTTVLSNMFKDLVLKVDHGIDAQIKTLKDYQIYNCVDPLYWSIYQV